MNRAERMVVGWIVTTVAAAVLSSAVFAGDNDCWLQAQGTDAYVIIYDEDQSGNKGQEIWRGRVREHDRQYIRSRQGSIRLHTSLYSQDPYSGDVSRPCRDNLTIQVP